MIGRMTVYQVFGLTTAFGILVAMLISLTLLPAMLACMPLPERRDANARARVVPLALMSLARWLEGHRRITIATGLVVVAFFSIAAKDLYVDYSWVAGPPATPVTTRTEILDHFE